MNEGREGRDPWGGEGYYPKLPSVFFLLFFLAVVFFFACVCYSIIESGVGWWFS